MLINSPVRCIRQTARASLTALALALCATAPAQAEAALEGAMTASVIVVDESGLENALPADAIAPGGVIEYALTYRNQSEDVLSSIIIDGPVPASTFYLGGSQTATPTAQFEAMAADIEWATPPLTRIVETGTGETETVTVPADEYTGIRWRVMEPLEPEGEIAFSYRVQVER